jgi:hypothetical protein
MKKLFVVAGMLATLMLGAWAGVVVAQGTPNPSTDVMFDPSPAHPNTNVSSYEEGVTIQEILIDFNLDCNGEGIVTTTRLGDRIVQEVVLTDAFTPGVPDGAHCSRSGLVRDGIWITRFELNTN